MSVAHSIVNQARSDIPARQVQLLILMARAPEPGRAKTRLAAAIGPQAAADLSACFISDLGERLSRLRKCDFLLAWASSRKGSEIGKELLPAWPRLPQGKGSLGKRLAHLFSYGFGQGYERICIVGSDHPTLPRTYVSRAFRRLETNKMVVGPTLDRGCYLIGMVSGIVSSPAELEPALDKLFLDVPWSTSQVLDTLLDNAEEAVLAADLLPSWYDVDSLIDLARLRAHLEALDRRVCPRTRAFLDEWFAG